MKPFTKLTGIVAPLEALNVDTDQIIPKQFLKRIERTGYGQYLFFDWRFRNDGSLNPDFEMNAPRYQGASILLAKDNFGCGSSREHAPWALDDYGIRAILAPSFADIFFNNCFKNGVLPIALSKEVVEALSREATAAKDPTFTIDLEQQQIRRPTGNQPFRFEVDPFRRHCLLNGLDDVGLTMQKAKRIDAFEARQRATEPWLYRGAA